MKAVANHKIDKAYFRNIKSGKDVILEDGRTISNAELTFDPLEPKCYAYCSDTGYYPDIIPQIRNVDVLYHEATFLESDAKLSVKTKHATAREAATIANDSNVGTLILGHYSTRYKSIELFKEEAQSIFPNVELAEDGKFFEF